MGARPESAPGALDPGAGYRMASSYRTDSSRSLAISSRGSLTVKSMRRSPTYTAMVSMARPGDPPGAGHDAAPPACVGDGCYVSAV